MTIKSKAIAATILFALSSSLAVAQGASGLAGTILDLTPRGQAPTLIVDRHPGVQPGETPHIGHGQSGGDACGAANAQSLIGIEVAVLYFPGNVRIIAPGTAVTRDHRPDRMNVRTDHDGRIVSVYCG